MKLASLIRKGGLRRISESHRVSPSVPDAQTVANVAVVAVAAATTDSADLAEWREERAAIIEFDGGFTRQGAERAAEARALARFSVPPSEHLH